MEEIYFNLCLAHKRTCDESNMTVKRVPSTYIGIVSQMLLEKGYDLNGYTM